MPCFDVLRVFCELTLRGVDVDLCGQFQEIFFTEITAVAFNHINHLLVAVVRCACVFCFSFFYSFCRLRSSSLVRFSMWSVLLTVLHAIYARIFVILIMDFMWWTRMHHKNIFNKSSIDSPECEKHPPHLVQYHSECFRTCLWTVCLQKPTVTDHIDTRQFQSSEYSLISFGISSDWKYKKKFCLILSPWLIILISSFCFSVCLVQSTLWKEQSKVFTNLFRFVYHSSGATRWRLLNRITFTRYIVERFIESRCASSIRSTWTLYIDIWLGIVANQFGWYHWNGHRKY